MISLKKALFAVCFGIGAAVSMSAWAMPPYEVCLEWQEACAAGDAQACYDFKRVNCARFYNM